MDSATLKRLTDQLKRHEGLRLKPYRCSAGKLTIGHGRNIQDIGISADEARNMLANDIQRVLTEAENLDFFENLNPPRQAVIINMLFNLGLQRFMKFRKMLAALRAGDYRTASLEMLDSRWAEQVGSRAVELSGIMRQGDW